MLNRRRDERDNIIDSSDEMPLEGHDSKDHVHRLLALGKNMPCCNQQHDVLIPFDGTAGRRCNPRPSYFMPLNFFITSMTAWLFVGFPSFRISSHTMFRRGMK